MELLYKTRCKELKELGLANEKLNNYENFKDVELLTEEDFKTIIRVKHNRQQKRCRTKNRFREIIILKNSLACKTELVFGTLTLDDEHLKLKEDTYIREIHKWMKNHFLYSILNKDFGKKTEREHYHFIGLTLPNEELESKKTKSKKGYEIYELKNKDYKLGFEPTLCKVNLQKNDMKQTTNYLLKLNNHSNKITSRNRVRIIKSPLMKMFELRKLR